MYKSASRYLGSDRNRPMSHLMEPYANVYTPPYTPPQVKERYHVTDVSETEVKPSSTNQINMKWQPKTFSSLGDPRVWGPPFWFSLHTSAAHYPLHPSPIVKDRMKGRILAIPFEIPCPQCKPHAAAFIEKHRKDLDKIVSSRQNLFNFYVDFHNKVNQRYGKPIMSYANAMKLYSGGAKVQHLAYN